MNKYPFPKSQYTTKRLILRKPVSEDANPIFENYAQDPEVCRFLTWEPHKSLKETRRFLKRCEQVWREGSSFPWSIIRKKDSQLIGMIEIGFETNGVIIGFVLAKRYWGKGYMPEAIRTVIQWCLTQEDIHRVWAFCDTENAASARALDKAGMRCEGVLRRWTVLPHFGITPRDCYSYSVIKSDIL